MPTGTYNDNLASDLHRVRRRVSDIGNYDQATGGAQAITGFVLSDAEITQMIADAGGNVSRAMANAANTMAAFFSQEPDRLTQANGTTVSYAKRAEQLYQLARVILGEGDQGTGGDLPRTTTVDNVANY